VLILGGTSEARALAADLAGAGVRVTSSLAGRVADPVLPAGDVRIGGFGGSAGLRDYLRDNQIAAVVDATHPYATVISGSAAAACTASGVPLLRLARPGWSGHPDSGSWWWVESYPAAAATAAELGSRILLTTGRTTLPHFNALSEAHVVVRLVDDAADELPAGWQVIRSRGPYTVEGERRLMADHRIDVLVTKDSGGSMTAPKLAAAALEGISVVVVRRPAEPDTQPDSVSTADSVARATAWVLGVLAPPGAPEADQHGQRGNNGAHGR
jgi:precorrin-6A/cobalt-precorrin-6A reductase